MGTRPAAPVEPVTIWNKDKPKVAERSDDERANAFGFGIVPGVRFGRACASTPGQMQAGNQAPAGFSDDASSAYVEPHLDILAILPGDYFGVGLEAGYSQSKYPGPTGGVFADVALTHRFPLVLTGNVGAVLGTVTDDNQSIRAGQSGVRYGGGLMYVVFRTRTLDGGLRLELEHYASGTATVPTVSLTGVPMTASVAYEGNALGLDLMMSFDSGGM
jgi:hypothetical protein